MKKAHRVLFPILWLTLTLLVLAPTTFPEPSDSGPTVTSQSDRTAGVSVLKAETVDRIVLDISSQQVVGHPLSGSAQLLLLDDSSSLVTDYDFAGDPLQLAVAAGSLSPDVIDDSSLFAGGIVDFLPLDVTYEGPSGTVVVTASNATVTSAAALISFSGYEILSASDRLGDPITDVYSGLPVSIQAPVTNGGDLTAVSDPALKAYFASGGGSVKIFIPPHSGGTVDTVQIDLPTTGLSAGEDTLILVLESVYEPAGSPLSVTDTMRTPVTVLPQVDFALVDGSLKPDSVFAGVPFQISFEVSVGSFSGPVDSTGLAIHLVTETDSILTTLYDASPAYSTFEGGVISYTDLSAFVDSTQGLGDGWFDLRLDFRLASGGNVFTLGTAPADSLVLIPAADLQYVDGSFGPVEVSSGQEATFEFDVSLDGAASMLLDYQASEFVISGPGFSTTTNPVAAGDSLVPLLNHLTTGQVFIPPNHLGETLSVAATISYYREGAGNRLTFETDFNSQPVIVAELPTVQIRQVLVLAPNSPNVNINQEFQVSFQIANLSTTYQPPFDIRMVSDGGSVFASELTIPGIPGETVIDSVITVTASALPNSSEIFRIDVASLGVNQLPPIDNIAQAMIQEPAQLFVSVILRGANDGYVSVNDDFDLILTVVNNGEAETSNGEFTLTTNGLDLGVADPLLLTVDVGQPAGIQFLAPPFDTSLTINFGLTRIPLDINTGLPAQIGETEFEINLAVLSEDLELLVAAEPVTPNVVLPGGTKELFHLTLDNLGASSVAAIRVEKMSFTVTDESGRPISVRSVMEVGSTGLFDGLHEVTSATAGGDRLNLVFDNFVINGSGPVELALRTRVLAEIGTVFGVSLQVEDIKAVFASGPIEGQDVPVSKSGGGDEVVNEFYTTVATDLEGSFIIRDNPFDPNAGPAEFQFFQVEPGTVIFRILTLTGEIVYRRTLPNDGRGGSRTVGWDGRNDKGQMVLNGVYLAVLTDELTGAQAVLKVAVLK